MFGQFLFLNEPSLNYTPVYFPSASVQTVLPRMQQVVYANTMDLKLEKKS